MIYLFTNDSDEYTHIHYFYNDGYIYVHNLKGKQFWKWLWYDDIECLSDVNPSYKISEFCIRLPETLIFISDDDTDDDMKLFGILQNHIHKNIFDKL